MLGEVICQVVGAAAPMDEELSLVDAVSDPVKSHVNGLGAALLYGFVGNAGGTCIVCLDWGCLLRMTHAFESGTKHCAVFGIVKESTELGFSGRRQD